MRLRSPNRLLAVPRLATATLLLGCALEGAVEPSSIRTILVLSSFSSDTLNFDDFEKSLDITLLKAAPWPTRVYREYLDLARFPANRHLPEWRRFLAEKYAGVKIDLVVLSFQPAARFGLENSETLFPGVPLLICPVDERVIPSLPLHGEVVVCADRYGISSTIEAALRLQPDTRRVLVIAGASSYEQQIQKILQADLASLQSRVEFEYVGHLPLKDIQSRLAEAPPNSIAFYFTMFRDVTGQTFLPQIALSQLARSSKIPIYSGQFPRDYEGLIVGGHVEDWGATGEQAGLVAIRMLNGERLTASPIRLQTTRYIFDWRQLQRWRIPESRLPANSILRFKAPTLWSLYRWYIIGLTSTFSLLFMLTVGLLVERRRRIKARAAEVSHFLFEKLVDNISARLEMCNFASVDKELNDGLSQVVEYFKSLRCDFLTFDQDRPLARLTHSSAVPPKRTTEPAAQFPWAYQQVLGTRQAVLLQKQTLPLGATVDRQAMLAEGLVSLALVPVIVEGEIRHLICLSNTHGQLPRDFDSKLRLLGELFGNALQRRRATETRLQYATVLASSEDAIISAALDGTIISWNAAAQQQFGFSAADAIGKSIMILIPPELRAEGLQRLERLSRGEHLNHYETAYCTKSGARVPVSLTVSPIRDPVGNITGISKIVKDLSERRRAEQAFRESEERFWLVANTAPVLIWMSGQDRQRTYFNKTWLDFTGHSLDTDLGSGWMESIHPADRERYLTTYNDAFDHQRSFKVEYRLRRFDGEFRWILDAGVPRGQDPMSFLGFIASCIDISEEREKEEKLRDLSGRLIAAHEEERTRIARELHDDFSQRMAMLLIGLDQLELQLSNSELRGQLRELAQSADQISTDIHSLAYQLHPSKLETLGLAAAVGSYCREVSTIHKLRVRFEQYDVPEHLAPSLSLCLYRVLQEGLRNVVKHSGADRAAVELRGLPNELRLSIVDEGVGLTGSGGTGIGLISMRERLRLIHGDFIAEPNQPRGTRIEARVPLADVNEQSNRAKAASGAF